MKALSIKQPHADNILEGKKTIELRSWNTKHRGPFLIHSQGFIIGKADLVDVKQYIDYADYYKDLVKHQAAPKFEIFMKYRYGFILKNIKRIHPKQQKGQLGFFNVDNYGLSIDGEFYTS